MDNREKGYTLFKKGLKYREIAEKLGVPESTVKSWATRYWKNEKVASKKVATKKEKVATEDATGKKKNRGGAPKGNVNAVGKTTGAPPGNKYAEKHGGYSRITLASLSEEEAEFLEEVGATDDEEAMLEHEIKLLTIRIARLMKQIGTDKYSKGLYVDSVETSETKRRFRTPEDEAEYYRLVQGEIDEGKRKPGEQYKVYTHTKNADDFILSVHEAINRAQALRQRCLDSLAKLREEKRANNPTTDARMVIDFSEPAATNGGIGIQNLSDITFAAPADPAGTVTHVAVMDSLVGGNMLARGELTESLVIGANEPPVFLAGDVLFYLTGNMSTSYKTRLLNFFRGTSISGVTPYFSLWNGSPEAAGSELAGDNYARAALTFAAPAEQASGQLLMSNAVVVTFNRPSTPWGVWNYSAIYSAASGGEPIYLQALTEDITIKKGYMPTIDVGALKVGLN